jgi:peroxiredoxin
MHALLLFALFQAPPPSPMALRAGCSADDEQIAYINPSDPVQVGMALAGEGETCYRITLERGGDNLTGYVLGDALAAIQAFVHRRELASKAASEAEARLAREEAERKGKTPDSAKNGEPAKPPDPLISTQFADFAAKDVNGKLVSLSGLKGKVTLVTFWSPSHPRSIGELRSVEPLYNGSHANGLAAVAISTDPRVYRISEALDENTLPFPQIPDTIGLAARYNIDPKVGKTIVLDQNYRVIAAGSMGPDMLKTVRQALNAPDGR